MKRNTYIFKRRNILKNILKNIRKMIIRQKNLQNLKYKL